MSEVEKKPVLKADRRKKRILVPVVFLCGYKYYTAGEVAGFTEDQVVYLEGTKPLAARRLKAAEIKAIKDGTLDIKKAVKEGKKQSSKTVTPI